MAGLTAYITDLLGNHLALVGAIPAKDGGNSTYADAELCGPRTGKVRIAATDRTAIEAMRARVGSRMLKIYYRPPTTTVAKLAFWGVAARPVSRMGGRVMEVTATDATIVAKRAFAAILGKPGGDDGVTIDGAGVEAIWASLVDIAIAVSVPTAGVVVKGGRHGSSAPGVKAAISDGQDYQSLIDTLADAIDGPDWDLVPLDTTLGEAPVGMTTSAWNALKASSAKSAFYSQLHTWDRKGNDLTGLIFFQFGTGVDNLADLEIEEAGDQTINVAAVGVSGGKDTVIAGFGVDLVSAGEVGLYGAYTSLAIDAKGADADAVAQQTAQAQVGAYADAPVFLTLTVKKDELARFYPVHTYDTGDFVSVGGESGALLIPYAGDWVKQVPARVTKWALQEDAQGRVQQTTTVVVGDPEED